MSYIPILCPHCGKPIVNPENFCPRCGYNLITHEVNDAPTNVTNESVLSSFKSAEEIYIIGEEYFYGRNGKSQNDAMAFEKYAEASTLGYTEAIFSQGWMYYYGRGVPQDLSKAFSLFQIAAEKGHRSAQRYMGNCYTNGYGVMQDNENGQKWYYKSALQGDHESEFRVGSHYFNKGDKIAFFQWHLKSAEGGYREAQISVACAYMMGQGIEKNYTQSKYWYNKFLDTYRNSNNSLSEFETTLQTLLLDIYSRYDFKKFSYLTPVTGDYFLPMSDGYCRNEDNMNVCQFCSRRSWNGAYYESSSRCQCF